MDKETKHEIMESVYQGLSYKEIQVKHHGISKRAIRKVIKEFNPELSEIISNPKLMANYRLISSAI